MTPVDIPKDYTSLVGEYRGVESSQVPAVKTGVQSVELLSNQIAETNTITVTISGKSCLLSNPEDEEEIEDDLSCTPTAKALPGKIAIQIINQDSGTTTLPPVIVDINQQDGTWQFNKSVSGSPGRYSININPVDVENGLICSGTTITYIVGEGGVIKLENPTTQTACFAIVNPHTGKIIYLPFVPQ